MNTGERNAARMIQKLKEKGIAEAIGSESMSQRGRPRPIYRIDLQRLSEEIKGRNKP
jgi:predicted transcriptional regulator